MIAVIDFSAQFGGREAAAALLPHFKALKAVASGLVIENFPFKKIAFILRVDGEVNSYNLSGPGNLDFDQDNYVSVDLGIKRDEYESCAIGAMQSIIKSLRLSIEFLKNSNDARLEEIDFRSLEDVLSQLIKSYGITAAE